jgi:hypothetical protein
MKAAGDDSTIKVMEMKQVTSINGWNKLSIRIYLPNEENEENSMEFEGKLKICPFGQRQNSKSKKPLEKNTNFYSNF